MTTIAWDCSTLAADRRATNGGLIRTLTKIWVVNGCLVGYSGDAAGGEEMLAWFRAGAEPRDFPPSQRSANFAGLLVIQPSGEIHKYEDTPYPVVFPAQHFAIGSGRDYAMAAMHLGLDAERAVGVAAELDSGTGNGVDKLTF